MDWALRQIGKGSAYLNRKAIQVAEKIKKIDSRSARCIGSDSLRELRSENVQNRIKNGKGRLGRDIGG